jgi:23S rRNA pseudouridine2605 synthase
MASPVRLQKYIADCGVTSRRKAEELIVGRHVKVNGQTASELGTKVTPGVDLVQLRGDVIDPNSQDPVYIVLHKPRSIISSVHDPEGRKTVLDLCKGIKARIYPIGRLDYLSEGLMILTNDGDFTQKILHPKFEVTKVYEVKVFGIVTEAILNTIRKGVQVGGDFLQPLQVRVIKQLPKKTWLEFRLNEGKNREIRRLCEHCELTIDKLKRVAIGNLSIHGIAPGEFRLVTKIELLKLIGLNQNGDKVRDFEYESPNKTIPKRKRLKFKTEGKPLATERSYRSFRKDHYYETLKKKSEEEVKTKDSATKEKN